MIFLWDSLEAKNDSTISWLAFQQIGKISIIPQAPWERIEIIRHNGVFALTIRFSSY